MFSSLAVLIFSFLFESLAFSNQAKCSDVREVVEYVDLFDTVMSQTEAAIAAGKKVNGDFDKTFDATEAALNKVELNITNEKPKSSDPAGIIEISDLATFNSLMSSGQRIELTEQLTKIMGGFKHRQTFSIGFTLAKSEKGKAEVQIHFDKEMDKKSRCTLAETISRNDLFVANLLRFFALKHETNEIMFSFVIADDPAKAVVPSPSRRTVGSGMKLPIQSAGVNRNHDPQNGLYRGVQAQHSNIYVPMNNCWCYR